jgi:uncharacterized OB-fold protein
MNDRDFSNTAYQQFLNEHRLMGARCQSCGALYLPPRPMCPRCFSQDMAWEELPLDGRLAAFTVVHIAPTAMIAAGYGRDRPYCSGVVTLEAGPSISAQILGVDVEHPEQIKIGAALKGEFLERGEGEAQKTFLVFKANG